MKVQHEDGRIETVRFGAIPPANGWCVLEDATLRERIEHSINCTSSENGSNTPDFILAEYLTDCLAAFDRASNRREQWYGKGLRVCGDVQLDPETGHVIGEGEDAPRPLGCDGTVPATTEPRR